MSKVSIISVIAVLVCIAITQALSYYAADSGNFYINYLAAYIMAVQWLVFIHAGGFFGNERTEKFYDITGSFTYLTAIILSLILSPKITPRFILLASYVIIWSVRLGWFLFSRIHNNNGVDSRFEEIKKNNFRFWMTWTLQGTWVLICLLPVLQVSQFKTDAPFSTLDFIGMPFWIFGFTFEVVADYQKSQFRKNPDNKGKFIDTGLWSISRHPNYFGEIVLWIGVTLIAFSLTRSWIIFISPVFVALLLIFISGIPMLEKSANERFAGDEKYEAYKKSTPVLIPYIGLRGNAPF